MKQINTTTTVKYNLRVQKNNFNPSVHQNPLVMIGLFVLFLAACLILIIHIGYLTLFPVLVYLITLKYFVDHPNLFSWMLALKFIVPLFVDSVTVFDLSSSQTEFVHWTELYSSGKVQIGDLLEFNRSSHESS